MSQRLLYQPRRLPVDEVAEHELVARTRRGDRWAEEMLFRRHARRILGLATRLIGDSNEAEDMVQEAFLEAYETLEKLRDDGAFGAWLSRIVVSRAHRRFRRRKLRSLWGLIPGGDAPLENMLPAGASPEELAELRFIEKVLGRTSGAARTAWVLRHVEGYKLDEVAGACGCSLATAKRRIAHVQSRIDQHTGVDTGASA